MEVLLTMTPCFVDIALQRCGFMGKFSSRSRVSLFERIVVFCELRTKIHCFLSDGNLFCCDAIRHLFSLKNRISFMMPSKYCNDHALKKLTRQKLLLMLFLHLEIAVVQS